jgi:hypothetical protein
MPEGNLDLPFALCQNGNRMPSGTWMTLAWNVVANAGSANHRRTNQMMAELHFFIYS